MLAKASPRLAAPLQPKTAEEAGKLKGKLAMAGFRSETRRERLPEPQVRLAAGRPDDRRRGGPVRARRPTDRALMNAMVIAGVMFYLPSVVLWLSAPRAQGRIFFGLPDALDLLVVCVEAGLGLDQAMRKVSEEMKKTCRTLSEEFGLCNFQLQMGRPRAEVLHELGSRTGVDDLRSLAAILIQADKFGSSIAQALRVQSDSMRTQRRQLAEEKAAKTAVKLIFPLVIFIFPAIFVVLVGPAAITMVNEMFPAMAGKK